MNFQFEWQPDEWREALLLASAGPRRPPKPVMTYALIGMMCLGAGGEVMHALRGATFNDYGGSIMPMLLFTAAIVLALQIYARGANRSRRLRPIRPMPQDMQELVFTEDGWSCASLRQRAEFRPWDDLCEQRTGRQSLILVGEGNAFAALPLRALKRSQSSTLQRLLVRKLQRAR